MRKERKKSCFLTFILIRKEQLREIRKLEKLPTKKYSKNFQIVISPEVARSGYRSVPKMYMDPDPEELKI